MLGDTPSNGVFFNGSNDKTDKNDQWCFRILYGFIMVDHNMEAEKTWKNWVYEFHIRFYGQHGTHIYPLVI